MSQRNPKKNKTLFLFLAAAVFTLTGANATEARAASIKESVIKIFVTSNPMDYYRPWQSIGSQPATGSGFVIAGNRILTNAHVVSDQTFIQIRKESNPKKFTAQVDIVGDDCDLALLTVKDPDFFKNVKPLEFGDLPDLQDTVTVIGFPQGGDKLSVTKGVVSRVEIVPYVQSAKQLLAVQIDAAINPGNSGGPVFKENKVVGVAMQAISSSQNIGYMIPPPIIRHFLTDCADGHYDGFPLVGMEFENTENSRLRRYYRIEDQEGGVVVNHTVPFAPSATALKPGDIVLKIDGVPIGVDGTFAFRGDERLSLSYLITSKQMGDKVTFALSRKGQIMEKTMTLTPFIGLVPFPNTFKKPPYYIYGGLVFSELSMDLLQAFGKTWWKDAPIDFNYYLIGRGRLNPKKRKNIVVLLVVLPDDINVGYHNYRNEVIAKVNGKEFKSFEEFVRLVENNHEDVVRFETDQKDVLILDTANIGPITQNILERNSIPAQYSQDVAGWLKKK